MKRCLLPAGLVDFVKQLQPRLAKSGLCIVDSPRTLLDRRTRELVVPEPTVPYDASVIAELDDGVKLGSELPWIRPGRYPLRTWFLTRSAEHIGALSPAVAATAALPTLFELDDLVAGVERLADLFGDVEPGRHLVRERRRARRPGACRPRLTILRRSGDAEPTEVEELGDLDGGFHLRPSSRCASAGIGFGSLARASSSEEK